MTQLNILCHQAKPIVPEMGCILLSHWPKNTHGKLQTTTDIAKAIGCSPQSDHNILLLKTIS